MRKIRKQGREQKMDDGEKKGVFVPGDKALLLNTKETDMAHRKMVVYTCENKPCVMMRYLILLEYAN